MAYVNEEKELVILLPHKTGTHTLRQILTDHGYEIPRYADLVNHPTLDSLRAQHPHIRNFYEYDVYAFYREPVERFMSFIAYNYRKHPLMKPYTNVFDYCDEYGYFSPQIRWLKHSKVEVKLLNFHNFESEMRRLMTKLGIPLTTPIPKLNASPDRKKPQDLTPEEIAFIKNLYKKDYEFFDSKGIKFNV